MWRDRIQSEMLRYDVGGNYIGAMEYPTVGPGHRVHSGPMTPQTLATEVLILREALEGVVSALDAEEWAYAQGIAEGALLAAEMLDNPRGDVEMVARDGSP